jgi:hypothetical protein
MSNGLVEQAAPPLQVTSEVTSSPNGESPGELLAPAAIVIFHPLKLGLEYRVVPVLAIVMVVAPLTTIIESAAATEDMEAATKAPKSNFFIDSPFPTDLKSRCVRNLEIPDLFACLGMVHHSERTKSSEPELNRSTGRRAIGGPGRRAEIGETEGNILLELGAVSRFEKANGNRPKKELKAPRTTCAGSGICFGSRACASFEGSIRHFRFRT